jgi:hypothetical protein
MMATMITMITMTMMIMKKLETTKKNFKREYFSDVFTQKQCKFKNKLEKILFDTFNLHFFE